MVFISPWDGRVMVPSFDPGKENFARVVLASPGDRELLRKSAAVAAFASRCIAGNKPQSLSSKKSGEKRRVLEEVAKFYDLPPDDIDKAILDWSSKSQDPYERGVFQLYEGNLAAARKELDAASHAKDLKPDAEARIAVTLGQALYAQENWKESANAYLLAFKLRPDASILEACVLSLIKANRCSEAEPLLQQALTPRVAPTPAPK
jgi:tetratricopeptide (TPR) repeat protein